jgi:hypothetical protein
MISLLLLVWFPLSLFAGSEVYIAKAAWLKNFPPFFEWPEKSGMANTSNPFIIGIIGESPINSILADFYTREKRKIMNKPVKIVYFSAPEEIRDCHLLFIPYSQKKHLLKILSITKKKPILTVGDTKGFARKGVHINFYQSGKKLRFEINPTAIREATLSVDLKFLKLGKRVKTQEGIP